MRPLLSLKALDLSMKILDIGSIVSGLTPEERKCLMTQMENYNKTAVVEKLNITAMVEKLNITAMMENSSNKTATLENINNMIMMEIRNKTDLMTEFKKCFISTNGTGT